MTDVADLVGRARTGDRRAVARLISLVEDASPLLREVMAALVAAGPADTYVVGLTGPPGVGKSTSTAALIGAYRRRGVRVGVLAIDPSSPYSGGALLGDRIRMGAHAEDDGVYIRSMAARGHLGGLSWAAPQALRVLAAAGCEVILLETVGVGQSEVEVAGQADTTLVLMAPGMGDGIQAAKAGILEVGDIYVVNKADREGAAQTARELTHMLSLGPGRGEGDWTAPVLKTVASRGDGVEEVLDAISQHRQHLTDSGRLLARRRRRAAGEVEAVTLEGMRRRIGNLRGDRRLEALADRVAAGELDPYAAADALAEQLAT
ncbi:methylmalonyl Co-A mutase-associated GTPase MeaB [Sporichthya brevicatena]|uniref:Methylmalonyl Co-A mutase-associated GTPase MeaB n=1 Tax=Sporichthya brevicatena TaxID=171442 RepID=A0ABP3SCS5_9ACTN